MPSSGRKILERQYQRLRMSANKWLVGFFNLAQESIIDSSTGDIKIETALKRLRVYLGPNLYEIRLQQRESNLIRKFSKWRTQAVFELWGSLEQEIQLQLQELDREVAQRPQTWFGHLFSYESPHILADKRSRNQFLQALANKVFPDWIKEIRVAYEAQQINALAQNLILMENDEETIKQLVKFPLSNQFAEYLVEVKESFLQCDCVIKFSNSGNIIEFAEEIKLMKKDWDTAVAAFDVKADINESVNISGKIIEDYKTESFEWIEKEIAECNCVLMLNAMPPKSEMDKNTIYLIKNTALDDQKTIEKFIAYWDEQEKMNPHEIKDEKNIHELKKLFVSGRLIKAPDPTINFDNMKSLCGYNSTHASHNSQYYKKKYYHNLTAHQFITRILKCLCMENELAEDHYILPLPNLTMNKKNLIDTAITRYRDIDRIDKKEKFFKIIELLYRYGATHKLSFRMEEKAQAEQRLSTDLRSEWKLLYLQILAIPVYNELEAAMKKVLFDYIGYVIGLFQLSRCEQAFYDWHGFKRGPIGLSHAQQLSYALFRSVLLFNDSELYTTFINLEEGLDPKYRAEKTSLFKRVKEQVFQPAFEKIFTFFGEMAVDRYRGIFIAASRYNQLRGTIMELREANEGLREGNAGLSHEVRRLTIENRSLKDQIQERKQEQDDNPHIGGVFPNSAIFSPQKSKTMFSNETSVGSVVTPTLNKNTARFQYTPAENPLLPSEIIPEEEDRQSNRSITPEYNGFFHRQPGKPFYGEYRTNQNEIDQKRLGEMFPKIRKSSSLSNISGESEPFNEIFPYQESPMMPNQVRKNPISVSQSAHDLSGRNPIYPSYTNESSLVL